MGSPMAQKPTFERLPSEPSFLPARPGHGQASVSRLDKAGAIESDERPAIHALGKILEEGVVQFQVGRPWSDLQTVAFILLTCGTFWMGLGFTLSV